MGPPRSGERCRQGPFRTGTTPRSRPRWRASTGSRPPSFAGSRGRWRRSGGRWNGSPRWSNATGTDGGRRPADVDRYGRCHGLGGPAGARARAVPYLGGAAPWTARGPRGRRSRRPPPGPWSLRSDPRRGAPVPPRRRARGGAPHGLPVDLPRLPRGASKR